MIRKQGSKYVLRSKKTGKKLGSGTKEEMKKRERQVNYFKHVKKAKGTKKGK